MMLYNVGDRRVQLRSVTEIAPKSPFLFVNRSPIRHDFRADAKGIRYSVNKALATTTQGHQERKKKLRTI